jgi:branched-chain amino acid transport system substrate-binding protein
VAGTYNTFGPDPRNNPNAKDVVAKFRAAGFEPEAYTLYSYAATQVIALAAAAAGSNDPKAVAKAIHEKGPFKTVIGELSFNEKGDRVDADYVVYQWKKGADGKFNYEQL